MKVACAACTDDCCVYAENRSNPMYWIMNFEKPKSFASSSEANLEKPKYDASLSGTNFEKPKLNASLAEQTSKNRNLMRL